MCRQRTHRTRRTRWTSSDGRRTFAVAMPAEDLILRMRAAGAAAFQRAVESDARAVERMGTAARTTSRRMIVAGGAVDRFGKSTQRAGRVMTRRVTEPIVGLGAAAVITSLHFDQAMT